MCKTLAQENKGIHMKQAAVVMTRYGQTVQLPTSVALPDDVTCVNVIISGRTRILTPVDEAWDDWFNGLRLSDDFTRDQPTTQERNEI
jgi:antitoxin VapB